MEKSEQCLPLGAMGGNRNWLRKGKRKFPGLLVVVPVGAWVHRHMHLSKPNECTVKDVCTSLYVKLRQKIRNNEQILNVGLCAEEFKGK